MKRLRLAVFVVCVFFILSIPMSVQAADDTYLITVEVPGEEETFTLEMDRTDYIGDIKLILQKQVDIDLNKMDLLYNGKVLSEVKRFSSGLVPTGATIKMQASSRFNYDEVVGIDDSTFSIARPKEENLTKVYAKDYGMSPNNEDNTAAFVKALKDCTANKYLVIEQGTYHFRNMSDDIALNNFENVIIDGNGSTFIFDTKYCMLIYGGNGVEIRNLKVNWDWDKIPVGSLVQIDKKISDTVFDIRFIGVDDVDENIPIGTFWYLDPNNLTIGSNEHYKAFTPGKVGGEYLKKVEKVDRNVLRITHATKEMKRFNEGEYYLLRHFEYSGRVFGTTSCAKNVTFDNVSIYGFTGMGWVFGAGANHFQIINSYLGLDPDGPKERRIATAADAIHILNTGGYFRISNNDLGFTGDDIINIHDDVMGIMSIDEDRTTMRGWATSKFVDPGDTVRFRNSQLGEFTDYEATVTSFATDKTKVDSKGNTYERIITFAEPLPAEITTNCYIYSDNCCSSNYVISNNYIHEARARAALLNDSYGVFENNYIYRVVSGAIQVKAGVSPGKYMEGEGASHIVARNNIFDECNLASGEAVVNVGIEISGTDSTEIIEHDIRIENNIFLNCVQNKNGLIKANNVDDLVITGNLMVNCGEIIIKDVVGKTTIKDNVQHTEHTYVNGMCSVCHQIWEKEIDGVTYCAIVKIENNRPTTVSYTDGKEGELAMCVARAKDVTSNDIVLAGTLTDETTGQKFVLTSIKQNVFENSTALSIVIPDTVISIGENALGNIPKVIKTGWKKIDGKWYYVNNTGNNQAGWLQYNSAWYFLNDSGVMQTDWQKISGKWYYFGASGVMASGWRKIDGKWYYFGSSGVMASGWKQIDSKWYYFGASGAMASGWKQINDKWYYFGSNGVMVSGWKQINDKWYYFAENGEMASAKWVDTNYYVDADGELVTSAFIKSGSKYYWVNKDGKYTKTYAEKDTNGYTVYEQSNGKIIR